MVWGPIFVDHLVLKDLPMPKTRLLSNPWEKSIRFGLDSKKEGAENPSR